MGQGLEGGQAHAWTWILGGSTGQDIDDNILRFVARPQHFDGVLAVKSYRLKHGDPDAVVSLLAIRFTPKGGEDPGGTIELVFSGNGAIRLDVECIDAGLSDVSGEWAARGRPVHDET